VRAFLRDPDGHLIELSEVDEVRSAAPVVRSLT